MDHMGTESEVVMMMMTMAGMREGGCGSSEPLKGTRRDAGLTG